MFFFPQKKFDYLSKILKMASPLSLKNPESMKIGKQDHDWLLSSNMMSQIMLVGNASGSDLSLAQRNFPLSSVKLCT